MWWILLSFTSQFTLWPLLSGLSCCPEALPLGPLHLPSGPHELNVLMWLRVGAIELTPDGPQDSNHESLLSLADVTSVSARFSHPH